MCSTFKLLLAAAVLHRVDKGEENLDRLIAYGKADILPHAPVAQANLAKGGLTVARLAEAVIEDSDNTCANKLIAALGGPSRGDGLRPCSWRSRHDARPHRDLAQHRHRRRQARHDHSRRDAGRSAPPDAGRCAVGRLAGVAHILAGEVRNGRSAHPAGCPPDGQERATRPAPARTARPTTLPSSGRQAASRCLLTVYFTQSRIDLPAREAVIADVARVVSGTLV